MRRCRQSSAEQLDRHTVRLQVIEKLHVASFGRHGLLNIDNGRLRLAAQEGDSQPHGEEHGKAIHPEERFGLTVELTQPGDEKLPEWMQAIHGCLSSQRMTSSMIGSGSGSNSSVCPALL